MLDFLIKYQRFIMLFLQGTCSFIAFLILITNSLCAKRKTAIFLLEVSAVLYLGAPITDALKFQFVSAGFAFS